MFGFSLAKLIVLAAIIAAVWYGFKWVNRYQQVQSAKAARSAARREKADAAPATEELIACPRCGTYVPAHNARACGRADCPY
jgi:ribosomal protein L32